MYMHVIAHVLWIVPVCTLQSPCRVLSRHTLQALRISDVHME